MLLTELSCVAILLASAMLRRFGPGAREWLKDGPIVFLAALIGEDTCIRFYDFYEYAPGWHLFVDRTPLLIPVIWIFVVLSARDVARPLAGRAMSAVAFLLIWVDASFIEPLATHAGLWRWKEEGPFSVPLIGTVGWACFGASVLFWLDRLEARWRWLAVLLAPATMHALLLSLWWGFFRWVGRATPEPAVASAVAVVLAAGATAWGLWRRQLAVPLWTVAPRIPPVVFFLALLVAHRASGPLWAYALAFVPPWLALTRWSNATGRPEPIAG